MLTIVGGNTWKQDTENQDCDSTPWNLEKNGDALGYTGAQEKR